MSNVRLLAKTEGAKGTEYQGKSIDEIIVGIARLSSSREINNLFDEPEKLLRHCILNAHWSIFTQANLTFEIITSRAIGRELLRHWSLSPQEISQRYVEITNFEPIELREQCLNNRQSSKDLFDNIIDGRYFDTEQGEMIYHKTNAHDAVDLILDDINYYYKEFISKGVSRETARFILPETTQTKLIFNGKIRDWITTLSQRLHGTAQLEIRLVAQEIRDIFIKECPIISKALYDFQDAEQIHIMDRLVLEKFNCYNVVRDNNFKKL